MVNSLVESQTGHERRGGLKLIQPKNQGSVSLDPEVIGHRQSKMSLKLGCIWRLSISSPQFPILIHYASLL